MAADQRLHEAKEAANQRLPSQDRPQGASEAGEVHPANQREEPRPDDADELEPDRPPQGQDQPFNEENLDAIVQRVQFGD